MGGRGEKFVNGRRFIRYSSYAVTRPCAQPIRASLGTSATPSANQWRITKQRLAQEEANQREACKRGICSGSLWMSSSQRWSPDPWGRVLLHGRLAFSPPLALPAPRGWRRCASSPPGSAERFPEAAPREVWLVEKGAFSLFYGQLFFSHLLFLAYNGLSLPWPDTIHDCGAGGGGGGGGWWLVRCKL